jgi:hypothetical protein
MERSAVRNSAEIYVVAKLKAEIVKNKYDFQ